VLEVVHAEQESGTVAGVIVQLGGQTPLAIADRLTAAGVLVVGTSAAAIDLAEDRGAFGEVLRKAGLPAPAFGTATSFDDAQAIAARIGYPVLVRPSYVLGGRGMEIVYDDATLAATSPGPRRSARSARCWSTGSSTTRSRSTSTPCATAARCSSAA
jgi:carbamoyl-phosphate synthase large subunit